METTAHIVDSIHVQFSQQDEALRMCDYLVSSPWWQVLATATTHVHASTQQTPAHAHTTPHAQHILRTR